MNELLSSIIEEALSYATPLPLTAEVTSAKDTSGWHDYQYHETENHEYDMGISQGVEAEFFPNSFSEYSLDKCVATQEHATQGSVTEIDSTNNLHSGVYTNVSMETVSNSDDLSNCSTSLDNLEPSFEPSSTVIEHDNPLTNLLKAPSDEQKTKGKRKRRSKQNKNGDDCSKNQSTKTGDNGEFGFNIPITEKKRHLTQEEAIVLEESLDAIPPVSPVSSNHSDNCVSSTTPSETGNTMNLQVTKKKQTRKREINPDRTPPPQILPPCKICDVKSSGFHYGANTCEACKGFFRRTLKKKEVTFQCKCNEQEREAWKRGPYKNGCPACRYERCLEVGMSKNAIKIGRYTLDRKTENIKEVKSLEAMDTIIQTAITEATNDSSPNSQDATSFIEALDLNSPEDMSTINMTAFTGLTEEQPLAEPIAKKSRGNISEEEPGCSTDTVGTDNMDLKEIHTIVKILVDGFTTHRILDPTAVDVNIIRQRQNKCLERYAMKTALFGKMCCPSNDEFKDFYNATGIELDDRFEGIQRAMKFFESRVSRLVLYAKCIPGFKELDIDDQANLIKASRVESMLIGGYRLLATAIDINNQVVVTPWGSEYHMEEIEKIMPKELFFRRYQMAEAMKKLDLTLQEEAVMRSIAITSSDRCKLNAPEKVEQIQTKLLTCLEHLLSVRPGGPGNKLYKIFDVLTKLRDFTEYDGILARKMFLDWPDLYSNYYLLSEFLR